MLFEEFFRKQVFLKRVDALSLWGRFHDQHHGLR
jgi:hypothetical protein